MGLLDLTAVELAGQIKSGKTTAVEAMEAVIANIDSKEEELNCYVTFDREAALSAAKEAQKKIEAGELTGPLAGVPIAIKDNMCTEGVLTTCSSKILGNFIPQFSSEAVKRIEEAGAVVIGKTNMDEFAMGSTTQSMYRVVLQAVRLRQLQQMSAFVHLVLTQAVLYDSLHHTAVLSA